MFIEGKTAGMIADTLNAKGIKTPGSKMELAAISPKGGMDAANIAKSAARIFGRLDSEIADTGRQLEVLAEMSQRLINDNAARAQNQDEYQKRFDSLSEQYEQAQERLRALREERQRRVDKRKTLERFIVDLVAADTVDEFPESLFSAIVEKMTVFKDGRVVVEFKDGSKIDV